MGEDLHAAPCSSEGLEGKGSCVSAGQRTVRILPHHTQQESVLKAHPRTLIHSMTCRVLTYSMMRYVCRM